MKKVAKKPGCLDSGGKGSKTAAGENQVAVAAPTAAAAADKHNEIIASALGSLALSLCRSNETGDGFW